MPEKYCIPHTYSVLLYKAPIHLKPVLSSFVADELVHSNISCPSCIVYNGDAIYNSGCSSFTGQQPTDGD